MHKFISRLIPDYPQKYGITWEDLNNRLVSGSEAVRKSMELILDQAWVWEIKINIAVEPSFMRAIHRGDLQRFWYPRGCMD